MSVSTIALMAPISSPLKNSEASALGAYVAPWPAIPDVVSAACAGVARNASPAAAVAAPAPIVLRKLRRSTPALRVMSSSPVFRGSRRRATAAASSCIYYCAPPGRPDNRKSIARRRSGRRLLHDLFWIDAPDLLALQPAGDAIGLDAAPVRVAFEQLGDDAGLGAGDDGGVARRLVAQRADLAADDHVPPSRHHALLNPAGGAVEIADLPPVAELGDD